jgi:hypothetical protein
VILTDGEDTTIQFHAFPDLAASQLLHTGLYCLLVLQRMEDIVRHRDGMWVPVLRIRQCNEAQPEINIGPLKGVLVALSHPGLRAHGNLVQVFTQF